MRNITDSTFPENILEEIGINKVSEKKIDSVSYTHLDVYKSKGMCTCTGTC